MAKGSTKEKYSILYILNCFEIIQLSSHEKAFLFHFQYKKVTESEWAKNIWYSSLRIDLLFTFVKFNGPWSINVRIETFFWNHYARSPGPVTMLDFLFSNKSCTYYYILLGTYDVQFISQQVNQLLGQHICAGTSNCLIVRDAVLM